MTITIEITESQFSDGIDLKIGEMLYRDISGITARKLGHAEIDHVIDQIADAQSPSEPQEPDYELASDRETGIPDHRWPA